MEFTYITEYFTAVFKLTRSTCFNMDKFQKQIWNEKKREISELYIISVLPFPNLLFHLEEYDLRQMLHSGKPERHVNGGYYYFLNFSEFLKHSKLKIKHFKSNKSNIHQDNNANHNNKI